MGRMPGNGLLLVCRVPHSPEGHFLVPFLSMEVPKPRKPKKSTDILYKKPDTPLYLPTPVSTPADAVTILSSWDKPKQVVENAAEAGVPLRQGKYSEDEKAKLAAAVKAYMEENGFAEDER